ncbi:MAG TPA: MFS transporter [Candidatus Acidoferrales bacterium]|nr:MFS transporter [Candidatus Acidoferrales bacterium]
MSTPARNTGEEIVTMIPARLDRVPWCRFHWLLVVALGITWILDGLEVTLMGAVAAVLQHPQALNFSATQIGFLSSCYLTGAVIGALVFGHLTDRFGRRTFFFITLALYLTGVGLTACAWNLWSFAIFRFITGAGIGGEYSAVNSAIDELIPAEYRGRIDLAINGSFWVGAALGSISTVVTLNPAILPINVGWRVGFAMGPIVGVAILYLRRFVPESPRWLLTHGRVEEAEQVVREIERYAAAGGAIPGAPPSEFALRIRHRERYGLDVIFEAIFRRYLTRSIVGFVLMAAQAFVYNAIFFTYALVLTRYYAVRADATGFYLLPFAVTNFLGPLLLGRYFDTIGRRQMIAGTYAASAVVLALTGWLFLHGMLNSFTQASLWTLLFFFASPAASSAYLTVSEIFPLEIRALAIAVFYSAGTAVGGIVAPWYFGRLIDSGSREALFGGYMIAVALMLTAAVVEAVLGVPAERQSLESIAAPLSSVD